MFKLFLFFYIDIGMCLGLLVLITMGLGGNYVIARTKALTRIQNTGRHGKISPTTIFLYSTLLIVLDLVKRRKGKKERTNLFEDGSHDFNHEPLGAK